MTEQVATAAAPEHKKQPKQSAKKSTKSAGKKKVTAAGQKAAKKAATTGANGSRMIHLTGTECAMRGKRLAVYKLMKDGMSVRDLQTAAVKKFGSKTWMGRTLQVLKAAEAAGLVKVK